MKPDLVLLHGALGASKQFGPLSEKLSEHYNVHTLNFEGHGGRNSSRPYSIQHFAENLVQFLIEKKLNSPFIFGYSMGGYVALYANSLGMDARKIMTLGTKFNWTPEGAQHEVKFLNPDVISEKVPHFAKFQADLHAPLDWKQVMHETAKMMLELGNRPVLSDSSLMEVNCDVLCTVGGKDNMVTADETKHVVQQISNAQFQMFESFEHPLEKIDVDQLANSIIGFLK